MSFIKYLDSLTINQISAGETIDRPASVIKELIENSLDAKSTNIDISLCNGGSKMIRVKDNGFGIDKKELIIAISKHTTSKINTIKDLTSLISFGFRGEALASIKSVSRLTLTSRTFKQSSAWQIYSEGDQVKQIKPIAHPVGTTLEISDLFYNTPVRKKFMRTNKTELIHVENIIKCISLSHFNVSFTLNHNGDIIKKYPILKRTKRIHSIFGDFFLKNSFFIYFKYKKMKLYGFISNNILKNKTQQYFYVNKRIINNKIVQHAILQSYYDNLRINDVQNKPFYLLYLKINFDEVDVNYHPNKKDIRFHNSRFIHDFIYQGITNCLQKNEIILKKKLQNYQKNSCIKNKKTSGINIFNVTKHKSTLLNNFFEKNKKTCYEHNSFFKKNIFYNRNCNFYRKHFFLKLLGNLLTIIDCNAVFEKDKNISIISIYFAKKFLLEKKIILNLSNVHSHKILIEPIRLDNFNHKINDFYSNLMKKLGIQFYIVNNKMIINSIPAFFYKKRNIIIPKFINFLFISNIQKISNITNWISNNLLNKKEHFNYIETIYILKSIEEKYPELILYPCKEFIQVIDVNNITT